MSDSRRARIIFSKPVTWLLWGLLFVMAFLLFMIIIPSVDFYARPGSVGAVHSSWLNPYLAAFFVCLYGVLGIVAARAWFRYVVPWWRKRNGA